MKIAVDTNVLVRAVVGDDLVQAGIAVRMLTDAALIAVALLKAGGQSARLLG